MIIACAQFYRPGYGDDGRKLDFDGNVATFALADTVLSNAVVCASIVLAHTGNCQNVATVL